jgi:hypothetical protein
MYSHHDKSIIADAHYELDEKKIRCFGKWNMGTFYDVHFNLTDLLSEPAVFGFRSPLFNYSIIWLGLYSLILASILSSFRQFLPISIVILLVCLGIFSIYLTIRLSKEEKILYFQTKSYVNAFGIRENKHNSEFVGMLKGSIKINIVDKAV